jgi:DNA (cytosine-5)-methyltransferase 1
VKVYDHTAGRLSDLDREVVRSVPPGGNWRNLPDDFQSRRITQIRESAARGEGSRSTYYGRLEPSRPAYTISTYFNRPGNGCFIHPSAPRLITVREAARLQGFPDSFRFTGKGRSRFIQVGNAVPPLLAYQLAAVMPEGTFVDLFSGAGGMSTGFEWAGHEMLVAADNDRNGLETLRQNGVPDDRLLMSDLSDPEGVHRIVRRIESLTADLDLLIGGPPCQGFSTAGKNLADDPRNQLVHAFLEVAERLRPRRILMENVPALMFRSRRPVLDSIRAKLETLGYRTDLAILHAEAYGLPQLRRRLFLSGVQEGVFSWPAPVRQVSDPAQIALQPGVSPRDAPPVRTVHEAIGDLPLGATDDPDEAVSYACDAKTLYQRWLRGEANIDSVAPSAGVVGEVQSRLAA